VAARQRRAMSNSTFFQNMCLSDDPVNRMAWLAHSNNLLDMDSNGRITISDVGNFALALLKLPGDLLIYELQNHARLGGSLGLSCGSYGGALALLLGLAGWAIWLAIPIGLVLGWDWLLRRLARG
jgi:hypothetical protein